MKPATNTAILVEVLPAHRPLTLKYFLRGLMGNLRIGLSPPVKTVAATTPGGHRLRAVITSAEQGRGRLAMLLSEYTFAVRSGDQWVNIGKAQGPGEREIRQLTLVLRRATVERFGRVAVVRPEVVPEVAFDGVKKSRHKGGYALVAPRVIGWERDKTAEDCDHLDRLKELFELTIQPAAEAPSRLF
jgi:ATP-dependent DNA ligase